AAKKALKEHLHRIGLEGDVVDAPIPSVYKIQYQIVGKPLISILIPNKDHIDDLSKCINSIFEKSTYNNFEIIVIENNSEAAQTFEYYSELEKNDKIRIVKWEGEFNYSAINNFGFSFAKGEYILFLNNDMEVITPDWLQEMLMFAQRKDVGAVGAKLYYPDDTVQHAGVIIGIGGVAGHSHKYFKRSDCGYSSRLPLAQNLSAVTAACMMTRKDVFENVGGLDEDFKIAFNDVDLCMRIRKAGYLIVFTPFAELYHYESKSRGLEDTPEKQVRFNGEIQRFKIKWSTELNKGDPYYNSNLTLDTEDFAVKYLND
ncbi:MAG: glycosyltransferase family 2 protein, partial [Ruminococcus flavefaciens]|nr:glycosyltransferase family 2 protein [Ruminococcus flavefaciens]